MTWVDIRNATERETAYLAQKYGFHQLDLEDCLSPVQRSKIDDYPDYLFLVLRFPLWHKETQITTPTQLSVFIGKGFLITLHEGKLKPLISMFEDCRAREEARQSYFKHGSGYLLYCILNHLTDGYFPVLDKIITRTEMAEDIVFAEKKRASQEVEILRRDIIAQRRIVLPLRAVFNDLGTRLQRYADTNIRIYWDDLMDHTDKVRDLLDEYKEVIEVLRDAATSLATYRFNRALRILTAGMTILTILDVVVCYFNMNIQWNALGENPGGSPIAWLIMLVACFLTTVGLLYYVRRKDWL